MSMFRNLMKHEVEKMPKIFTDTNVVTTSGYVTGGETTGTSYVLEFDNPYHNQFYLPVKFVFKGGSVAGQSISPQTQTTALDSNYFLRKTLKYSWDTYSKTGATRVSYWSEIGENIQILNPSARGTADITYEFVEPGSPLRNWDIFKHLR